MEVAPYNPFLEERLKEAEKIIEFYANTKDYSSRGYHGAWIGYCDDYSDYIGRILEDDGKRAIEYQQKYMSEDSDINEEMRLFYTSDRIQAIISKEKI